MEEKFKFTTEELAELQRIATHLKTTMGDTLEPDDENYLRQQLEKTGKARPATVGYPQFSSAFRNVIYELKDNDVASVLNNKTAALQLELDKLKKLG